MGYSQNTLYVALSTPPRGMARISANTARCVNDRNDIDCAMPQFSISDCVKRVCRMNEWMWKA